MPTGKKHAGKHDHQEAAFNFLKGKAFNQPFPVSDIDAAAGWKPGGAATNINKYLDGWLRKTGNSVEVLPEFRRVTLEQFIRQSAQKRKTFANFTPRIYEYVTVFEFLLPLTRESQLRAALDDLFFREGLTQRFEEIGTSKLHQLFPPLPSESPSDYEQRLLDQIEDWFEGYSINHVAGRFRIGTLRTRAAAAKEHAAGYPYLIDETTAVVTFIVPLDGTPTEDGSLPGEVRSQVLQVRGLFQELFVRAVVRTVEGEEVVWFLEDSPLGRKLHEFEKQRK